RKVKESLNVTFDETPPPSKTSPLVDDDLDEEEAIKVTEKKNLENDTVDETLEVDEIVNIKESRNHPLENIIGNLIQRTLRNKLDENGVVSQNKARLVIQGYNQQEGIDYDKTYAPVARLESIKLLLAYAYALDFKLFQMDVKSAFLNILINEEGTGIETVVYVNSDHAGDYVDRKSTSGIFTFVGCCLTSWFSKKQTALAISTTEAEYVIARKACQQALWMKQALIDYDVRLDDIPIIIFHSQTNGKDSKQTNELLPYGMFMTQLFKHVVSVSPELAFDHYLSHNRAMHPLSPHYERKTRSDHGKKRPRESNTSSSSSSTTQNHPSLSLPLDATGDENDDESFHSHSSSPSQNISSSSNVVPRVRQNLPHENHMLNTYFSKTINIQTQQRDDHQDGLRSIGQAIKDMMSGKRW
nr:retrovirus-related Pol polyprotein from transposon TNT 1-94 [Tanacetum cinerariifolium]